MKIIITGATGYIGQKLALKLANTGNEVIALVRKIPENRGSENIKYHRVDLNNPEEFAPLLENADAFFHLAAFARTWSKNPEKFFDVNVKITDILLSECLKAQVPKFIFTSSCATFGASGESPLQENDPRMCDFFTLYESSKFIAEKRVLEYHLHHGLNSCILHPTKVYGPGIMTASNAISGLIKSYLENRWHFIPGSGEMKINLGYIDDIVDGHILALHKARPGNQYLLGGTNTNYNELFHHIRNISGKKYKLFNIPPFAMNLYGLQQELQAVLFNRPPLITRKWVHKLNHDLAVDCRKAKEELGYHITPLEDGLKETIDWLQDSYNYYSA